MNDNGTHYSKLNRMPVCQAEWNKPTKIHRETRQQRTGGTGGTGGIGGTGGTGGKGGTGGAGGGANKGQVNPIKQPHRRQKEVQKKANRNFKRTNKK